jgi:hypothetical protein
MKIIYLVIILFLYISVKSNLFASETDLLNLAESHNKNNEYYNAITEVMRYQYVYPNGTLYPRSMLILSEAYYKGGNYEKTIKTLTECYQKFKNFPEGEKALYSIGFVRLMTGSPFFALRSIREYEYIFANGKYKEDISRDLCYTMTLIRDLNGARKAAYNYEANYPAGKYLIEINDFRVRLDEEINRPKKSLLVSVIGSVFIPGFGSFYTGKYDVGIFSFVSNAIFSYLLYNAYKDNDKTQMIAFGFAEFTFYQYSLYSSIRNVYEYNNNEQFYKSVRISASKEF